MENKEYSYKGKCCTKRDIEGLREDYKAYQGQYKFYAKLFTMESVIASVGGTLATLVSESKMEFMLFTLVTTGMFVGCLTNYAIKKSKAGHEVKKLNSLLKE